MLHIRTILHPNDFSPRSKPAFQMAVALARDYNARLVVLHVLEPWVIAYGEGIAVPPPENYLEEVKAQLVKVRPTDERIAVEHRLIEGDPAPEILRSAVECKADLIVMGTHGRTGLSRLLMGSVAEHVIRKAACPVLTVKAPLAFAEVTEEHAVEETVEPLEPAHV
jgi:universal stress protein A